MGRGSGDQPKAWCACGVTLGTDSSGGRPGAGGGLEGSVGEKATSGVLSAIKVNEKQNKTCRLRAVKNHTAVLQKSLYSLWEVRTGVSELRFRVSPRKVPRPMWVPRPQRSAWGGVGALAALALVRENTLDRADVTRASTPEPCLEALGRGASVDKAEGRPLAIPAAPAGQRGPASALRH